MNKKGQMIAPPQHITFNLKESTAHTEMTVDSKLTKNLHAEYTQLQSGTRKTNWENVARWNAHY